MVAVAVAARPVRCEGGRASAFSESEVWAVAETGIANALADIAKY
jgi:hypothetical protein